MCTVTLCLNTFDANFVATDTNTDLLLFYNSADSKHLAFQSVKYLNFLLLENFSPLTTFLIFRHKIAFRQLRHLLSWTKVVVFQVRVFIFISFLFSFFLTCYFLKERSGSWRAPDKKETRNFSLVKTYFYET